MKMIEIKRVPVADGPGMVAFSPDGKIAYVCSSFTPELDIVDATSYKIIKRIKVVSSFSPNIFTSPDGKFVAMTHKDVGKVTVINAAKLTIERVITTGAITNHVTFTNADNRLLMFVTVGGENALKVYDVSNDFTLIKTIATGAVPHGVWPSADSKFLYVGIEYGDQTQCIDLESMTVKATIPIGQSPQALVYADNAVSDYTNSMNLVPLNDTTATRVVILESLKTNMTAVGRIAVRAIGLTDLVEQLFTGLTPNSSYTLALTKASNSPYTSDYEINKFIADENGKYAGQSTGLIKAVNNNSNLSDYKHIVLIDTQKNELVLIDQL